MPSIETIYRETVRPLPVDEQKRLADMILENVESESLSSKTKLCALDVLNSIHAERIFRTSAEVDKYIRTERDSWDE